MLATRSESGCAATSCDGIVHRRIGVAVHDEVLLSEIGDRENRFNAQPVVDWKCRDEGFLGNSANDDVGPGDRRPQHGQVELAGS